MNNRAHTIRWLATASLMLALSACGNTLERLENAGKEPPLSRIENPTAQPNYKPVSWPMPEPQPMPPRAANSLWQPGAKAFFRDQRARNVGDILTVTLDINELARMDNSTERTRDSQENMGAPALLGLEDNIFGAISGQANPANLFNVNSKHSSIGEGRINRREQITTAVAAMVTQVLPNGNLVISGRQQIRVNYELREVGVEGVVRPEDITSENRIDSTKVAEARFIYGGRGQMSDIQQPRYGTQIIDILSPF